MKKRLLLITRFFPPESGAAAERIRCFAKYLADDYDIVVLTTMPSYPAFRTAKKYRWKLFVKEVGEKENIIMYRFWSLQIGTHFVARLISDMSFVVGGVCTSLFLKRPYKVIVSSPPFFLGFLGLFWKHVRRVPYIFDVRDLYPDSLIDIEFVKNAYLRRMLLWLERTFYRHAAHVTTVSDWVTRAVEKRSFHHRVSTIYNGVDISQYKKQQDISFPFIDKTKKTAVYVGNFGRVYDFDIFIEAAKKLSDWQFIFIGGGWQESYLRVQADQIKNIVVVSSLDSDTIPALLSQCNIGFVAVKDIPLAYGSIPTKVFEYIAAGLPVVAKVYGEAREYFDEYVHIIEKVEDVISFCSDTLPVQRSLPEHFSRVYGVKLLQMIISNFSSMEE